jgi:hypothetical protein
MGDISNTYKIYENLTRRDHLGEADNGIELKLGGHHGVGKFQPVQDQLLSTW